MSNGKGDTPRPISVDADTYAENYARTFSRHVDDPSGYDEREKFCPPLTTLYDDRREAMRQANLEAARTTITNAPPMSADMRDKMDKAWADFDAAYPKETP
jgi:hypothetical protein